MDYQCIVVYTIVRICPFYPDDSNCIRKRRNGCFQWIKTHVKRFAFNINKIAKIERKFIYKHICAVYMIGYGYTL